MKKYDKNSLEVVYASDEKFIGLTGISIYSLLQSNEGFEEININIIDNGIKDTSKEEIDKMVNKFNRSIRYIPSIDLKSKFDIPNTLYKNLTVYNNLFLTSLFDAERILYLDGDLIVVSSLKELWETDIDGFYFAAVQDTCGLIERFEANVLGKEIYFNSGVILFNLELCREDSIENKFIDAIQNGPANPIFRSQRVLNQVCKNKVLRISPKFNLLNPYIEFTLEELRDFFQIEDFYSENDLEEANRCPVIIHFAGVERPWCFKKCRHKFTKLFWEIAGETCWKDISMPPTKVKKTLYERFLHYHLPHTLFMKIKYINRKYKNYRYFKNIQYKF